MKTDFDSILGTLDKDPHNYYEQLRSQGEVVWDPGMKGWLVMSYKLCRYVEEREDLYRHPYADANEELLDIKGGPRNITVLQGEEHQKVRKVIARMFAPNTVKDYTRDYLDPIITHLFDSLAAKDHADLAAEVADQLPPRVFVALMGLDWMDQQLVDRELVLHNFVMDWIGGSRSAEATQRARDASHELNDILMPQVRKQKTAGGNDIISRLWKEAPEIFAEVSDEDITAICRELFLAGSDTSVHAIANAYYLLLTQPDLAAAVRQDRGAALDTFVEESLRLLTVVQYRFRVANQDGELGGVAIKKNDLIIPINAAGNRDPERFACPHQVDLNRTLARQHLAFNLGTRMCIGAPLARAELREVIIAFLDRLPNVKLDAAKPPPSFANIYTRSYRPLHVTYDDQSDTQSDKQSDIQAANQPR